MGEALNRLLRVLPAMERRISDTRRIIGFRNRLIHGYMLTQHDIVWNAVQTHVPILRREAEALLRELDAQT